MFCFRKERAGEQNREPWKVLRKKVYFLHTEAVWGHKGLQAAVVEVKRPPAQPNKKVIYQVSNG